MDWRGSSRWRKAWIISFILHCFVLTSAGWMAGKAFLPAEPPETLIELELSNEPEGPQAAALPEQSPASAQPVHSLPQQTAVNEPVAEEPVVAVSSMSVESVDTSAIVTASAAVAGGGCTAAGESGSGQSAGGGSGQGSGGGSGKSREIIPPGILSRREPVYPEQARRGGIEGTVVLRIEILENGRAGAVSVSSSSGTDVLDEAAVEAVRRWRFVPAKVRGTGQSISCQTTMPVVFRLRV